MTAIEFAPVAIVLGAALATGIGGIGAAIGEGQIGAYSMKAIERQPNSHGSVMRTMLIGMAITETGAIFSLVVSLLLLFGGFMGEAMDFAKAFALLGAGITMGLGVMGPNIGCGDTGAEASAGVGRIPSHNTLITSNMLIGQALTQTRAIFALIIALLLLYTVDFVSEHTNVGQQIALSSAYMAAALSISIGTLGSVGVGLVKARAIKMIARFKENQTIFLRNMLIAAAVVETCAIYSLVLGFLLIFVI
jgi:ATP synthase F0 subunit c